ncbi:MAG TPA: zf-TFIIB domain-containing protein [Chitinolyticbacter sp.]|uniref:TFIIB-type zinc ribbon-containing protein n=1 Tax=Chitinolyticbacter albus TaxID=2961951 RepID=UPI0021095B47|nr:zf-TFIIB domain-containing protein [Chitinolyticbacter albus]HSC81416.1 zf-TFIIB domain-containing protein [Chitinolyticbacter sp.]
MDCPVCKTTQLVMSERAGVEIDYCPQCRGVWLDRGELDKIIERAAREMAPSPQQAQPAAAPAYQQPQQPQQFQQPQQYHGDHYQKGHKPYRKKSFLEELFD